MFRLILSILFLTMVAGCATNSRNISNEFRIVADQGLIHAPDAAQMSLVPIASLTSRRASRLSADGVRFAVDQSRAIVGRPLAGVWAFEVPDNPNEVATQCYVAYDGVGVIPLRAEASDTPSGYAVSLAAALTLQTVQLDVRDLEQRGTAIQRRIQNTRNEAARARSALQNDPLFADGQCSQEHVNLPPRPANYLTSRQVHLLAHRHSAQCQIERMGCDITSTEFVNALRLPPITGIPAGYACGQLINRGICPADNLTFLADLAQSLAYSCFRDEGNDNDLVCAAIYAGTLLARYRSDFDVLSARYSEPARDWVSQIDQLNLETARRFSTCQSNIDTSGSEQVTIADYESQLSANVNAIEIARQIARDNRPFVWQGDTTSCNRLTCQGPRGREICGIDRQRR